MCLPQTHVDAWLDVEHGSIGLFFGGRVDADTDFSLTGGFSANVTPIIFGWDWGHKEPDFNLTGGLFLAADRLTSLVMGSRLCQKNVTNLMSYRRYFHW